MNELNLSNIVNLYSTENDKIKHISAKDNVLIFTTDASNNKMYRGTGLNKPLELIGAGTAQKLEYPVNIYGNTFDGTNDVSNNLKMSGTLDNSTGSGIFNDIEILGDASINKLNVLESIDASGLFLRDGILRFIDVSTGLEAEWRLYDGIKIDEIITSKVVSKVFDNVDDIFNTEKNNIENDVIGTTYIAKHGNSDINIPEQFILFEKNNDGTAKIIPTSSYLIINNTEKLNALDASYNYSKGNILVIDKLYSNDNQNDSDNTSGTLGNDPTIITPQDYRDLRDAVNKLYYILGIDLDAGKTEDSIDSSAEGIDGGEFDLNTPITSTNFGLILTDINNNQRTAFSDFIPEEKPGWLAALDEETSEDNEITDDDVIILPDELSEEITEISEHFVKAIRIKRGTYSAMMDVSSCLLDGELIWCKYDKDYPVQSNKLFIKSTDKSNNPQFFCINPISENDGDDNDDYLTELVDIEKIDWLTENLTQYRMDVNNQGKLTISPLCKNQPSLNSYYNTSKNRYNIYINSLYCGGLNSNKLMFRSCSHNFIELSNLTNYDINLADAKISLQYIDRTRYNSSSDKLSWEILPLTGTIKAGGTYLIRGAECAPLNCNTTRLKIETYDQEWYDKDGNLMSFDTDNASFVLFWGNTDLNGNYYSCTHEIGDIYANGNNQQYCFDGKTNKTNFLNTIGIKNYNANTDPLYYENKFVNMGSYKTYTHDALIIQYFTMDSVNQAITDGLKRNNHTDMYVINLNKNYQEGIDIYYNGKASFENKNLFYNKTDLGSTPNMVFCTFGKKATDDGDGATRCFNWLSIGYYNEYLKLTYPDGSIKYFESFKNNDQNIFTGQLPNDFIVSDNHYNDENSRFSYKHIYDRYRTLTTNGVPYTVHKLIIDNLSEGTYKYQVGKNEGWSEEYTFEVLSDDTIEKKFNNGEDITFIHHSDQQGFNKDEYKAWEYVVEYIMNNKNINPNFSINTGDMTQNGNRINEWLDYYNAGKKLFKFSECMHTVGNNDLSPVNNTVLGDGGDDSKLNPKNFDIFFCHDLSIEEQDLLTIQLKNETFRLIPSNYSFDYGNCHFICINSELPKTAIMKLFNENADEYANKPKDEIPNYDSLMEQYSIAIAERLEDWLNADCTKIINYNNSIDDKEDKKWIIAYCHEMPFTILTHAVTLKHQPDRLNVKGSIAGCRTNGIKSHGKYYWLSRLFDKYHIPLILGGHKHTYCMSARIKENIIINDDGTEDYKNTYRPIIQLKRSDLEKIYGVGLSDNTLKEYWYNTGKKRNNPTDYPRVFEDNICDLEDIEIIDDVNKDEDFSAPMYVMQTAAGYKLISNKELPAVVIPWLTVPAGNINDNSDRLDSTYFPATAEPKVNANQLYPYFTVFRFNKNEIIGTPIRMSQTVDAKTQEIYYKGNTKSEGTYNLINKSYTPEEISNWTPDVVNGMIAGLEIKITNKPF